MQKNKAICFILTGFLGITPFKDVKVKSNNLFQAEQSIEDVHINKFKQIKEIEELANETKAERDEEEKEELLLRQREENQRVIENRIYCKFEVSFYTTAADEGSGTGIGASGEYVQPWVSIALPKDIPFYSTATIEGLGTFVNVDTGSYIQWNYDEEGNLVCRVDVCVSTKEEAFSLGRFYADGYIIIN